MYAWCCPWRPSMCWSSGMVYGPPRRVSCRSRSPSLVCKIPILLFGFAETNTIGSIGARADQSALQVPMLTHHKVATTRGNTPQKISRTKVAIRYPQVIWGDQGEDLAQQRPFLRVSVLAQNDLSGQHRLLFQNNQK